MEPTYGAIWFSMCCNRAGEGILADTSLGLQTNHGEKWSSRQPQGGVWSRSWSVAGAHRFWTWLRLEILYFLTEQPWFWVKSQPSDPVSTGVGRQSPLGLGEQDAKWYSSV